MPLAFCSRDAFAVALALLALSLSPFGPASAQTQPPNVGFWPGVVAPPDSDPASYIVERATGPRVIGTADSYFVREGWGRASVPEGQLSLSFFERYDGMTGSPATSDIGNATTAVFFDTLVAGASGTLTLTLSGHAALSASSLTSAAFPLLRDDSWAGYTFGLYAQVFNPGGGSFVGGGGEARSLIEDRTRWASPHTTSERAGAAGTRKAIESSATLDGRNGGTMSLTAWVNAGDRLRFTVQAGAMGWTDKMPGAFSFADLANTGTLSVSGSPGMSWRSESGVLLSAVPEPAAVAQWAAGLILLGAARRQSLRKSNKKARARRQSRLTVATERPSACATSSSVRPPK